MRPLEVFVRHCLFSDASAHKLRPSRFSKQGCHENLLRTLHNERRVHLTLFLDTFYDTTSQPHFLERQGDLDLVKIRAGTEAGSFLCMLQHIMAQPLHPDTLIYLLEDDYLHREGWVGVLREAFTLPEVSYATLYDHRDKYDRSIYPNLESKLLCTASSHWRTTPSTTNTYAMKFGTLQAHYEIHRAFSLHRRITADHDKFLALRAAGAQLVSPIPGWSTHAEPDFMSPCIDWDQCP